MSRKELLLKKKMVLIAVMLISVTMLTGFIWGQKKVEIVVDGKAMNVSTLKSDPKKIIAQAGIVLDEKDEYRLSTERVKDNTTITVYRAVPVTVNYKGETMNLITGKPTVGELLEEMKMTGAAFRAEPGLETKITKDVQIKVIDVTEKTIERTDSINYNVVHQPDYSMEKGNQELVQQGQNGEKTVQVKMHYDDGIKTSEEIIEETVVKEAVPKIIKVGARDTIETSRGAMRFKQVRHMEATAYLPTDGGGSCITATGMRASHGVVAVDPSVIPLGSRLYIPGYGVAIAADTGGAINGNKIDLCMEDYGQAMQFGRRSVKVYILD